MMKKLMVNEVIEEIHLYFSDFFDTFSDDLEDLEFNPWFNHTREKIIWNPEDVKVNIKDPLELIQEKNYIKI